MIWFTSDTHFGHANVLDFCERPWDTIEAMNDALVDAINERVAPTDTLYHLGDFSFKMTVDAARELRGRIRCRDIHWVPGNHDKDWSQPAVAGTFVVEPAISRSSSTAGARSSCATTRSWTGRVLDTARSTCTGTSTRRAPTTSGTGACACCATTWAWTPTTTRPCR